MRAGTRAGLVPVCPHRTWHKGTQAEHALGIACVTVEREMAYERFLRTTVVSCLSLLIPPGLSSNSASFRKPSKTFHAGSGAPLPALPHLSPTPPPTLWGVVVWGPVYVPHWIANPGHCWVPSTGWAQSRCSGRRLISRPQEMRTILSPTSWVKDWGGGEYPVPSRGRRYLPRPRSPWQ